MIRPCSLCAVALAKKKTAFRIVPSRNHRKELAMNFS
jgi:hypothetical protein